MRNKELLSKIASFYSRRFGYKPPMIEAAVHPDTKMMVVIPCYDEPDLLSTLISLSQCEVPRYPAEVIVVINAGLGASSQVTNRNQGTLEQAHAWLAKTPSLPFSCQLLYIDDLPEKHAGVGLARKIGMDEALYRFASISYPGLILCLDADCTVAGNYLKAIEARFLSDSPSACCVYFEHSLNEAPGEVLHEGIIHYELFLRYYVNALRYADFPFAMHTIGSSMGVRADIYAKTGGMNRRKAGEDFYFLHKVAPQGHFININNTAVYPSSRISHRVPFGTGKAQADWQNGRSGLLETYHFRIFEDLKLFLYQLDELYQSEAEQESSIVSSMPDAIRSFLKKQKFESKLREIKLHTNSRSSFRKRFFSWFDGFKVLKFVHFARDHFYSCMPLREAASILLQKLNKEATGTGTITIETLLQAYRKIDQTRS